MPSLASKFAILLALWFTCFLPVYPGLVKTWLHHSDNSHGILVPLIALYLIWQKRDGFRSIRISNANWGAVILAGSLVLYLLSYAGGIPFIQRSMIVFSLSGLILFTLGKEFFLYLSFPILFLVFMVPVPDSILGLISLPLQLFATKISGSILQAFSIPAYREGNMVYFAQSQLEIAEACSGIRSIVSYGMLGFIFAYWMDRVWWKRVLLVLSTVPLAMSANIIRVVGTGILVTLYGDKVARGFLHEFSGLAVFFLGFILLLAVFLLLNKIGKSA